MSDSGDLEEIISYDNTFNKTSLTLFTQVQLDVLMAVLSKMGKEVDEEGRLIAEYKFKEIRRITRMQELYASRLIKTLSELMDTKVIFFDSNGESYSGNLFSECQAQDNNIVKVTLSKEMTKKLILNKKEYTILQLDEYVKLKNKYAKELYRLLRQFRHTGLFIIKKEDLLKVLSPPKSYNEYDSIRRILNPAIECNKEYFKELKLINFTKNGNGLPDTCKFTFKKHSRKNAEEFVKQDFGNLSEEEIDLLKYIMENGGA